MNKNSSEIFSDSINKAFKGGIAGASAMFFQVGSLMCLRTTMNYQYRYGISTTLAIKQLYQEGGIRRFYRGGRPSFDSRPFVQIW